MLTWNPSFSLSHPHIWEKQTTGLSQSLGNNHQGSLPWVQGLRNRWHVTATQGTTNSKLQETVRDWADTKESLTLPYLYLPPPSESLTHTHTTQQQQKQILSQKKRSKLHFNRNTNNFEMTVTSLKMYVQFSQSSWSTTPKAVHIMKTQSNLSWYCNTDGCSQVQTIICILQWIRLDLPVQNCNRTSKTHKKKRPLSDFFSWICLSTISAFMTKLCQ